jgi:signal transduction histidine kinase/ligand-binding sensor domain-containing protein
MKFQIIITAIIVLPVILQHGTAQNNELKFNLVEGANGKPLGKINAITQDPHGYMWFAGQSAECLYRYDGNRMISFRHDDANQKYSLGGTSLETVYADSLGMIWVGFNPPKGGLDQFNPATGIFKHYRTVPNDPYSLGGTVTVILRDRGGTLWVGTINGLDRLDEKTGKFIHYRNEPGNPRSLSSNNVRAIYEDRKGVLWIGTGLYWENNNDGGLNRFDRNTGTFTRYLNDPKNPHSLINNKVRAIFEDSRGTFWVGTKGDGLHTMDREKGSFERHHYNPAKPDGLSRPKLKQDFYDHITFINEDSTGAIWIGTNSAGINRYDPVTKKITHYQASNGFPDSTCWNSFISRDGVLWISTQASKLLYRVDPFHKTIHTIPTVNQALSFLEDRKGYLWVGTFGNGLLKFDQHKNLLQQLKYEPSNPFSNFDNVVACIIQKGEDTILVGTGTGVRIFNKVTQQFSLFHDDGNLDDSAQVGRSKIYQDKQGLIWFGRYGPGLFRYNPKDNSSKAFLPDAKDSSSIGSGLVNSILEDRSGVFWVAAIGGINRLNRETGRFKHYVTGHETNYLYEDSGGTLWAGTDMGLFQYSQKEDRFTSYFDPQSELNSFNVGGIIEDNSKNLWLTSPSAIIRLNPSTKETFVYGSRFGISPNSLLPYAATYKDEKGQLFIGSPNGFYTFSPEELSVKTDLKIIITDFFINTLPVLPGKGSPLQKQVDEISDLDLKYNQNNIAFDFAAIDYREPEATKYFIMLENYDNTWREVVGEKRSNYFNLSAGKYVYRVKAFNSDGTKAEKAISFQINPPWWETWWFRTLAGIFLVGLLYAIYLWRTASLRRQKRILEQTVKERTAEVVKEKAEVETTLQELKSAQAQLIQSEKMASLGQLTAGIAHEIQNPLNFVNNFSEVSVELLNELKDGPLKKLPEEDKKEADEIVEDLSKNMQKIKNHGKRADAIVKGMLQHTRSSSGVKESTDINALADEYLRLSYHGFRAKDKSFNVTLQTDFDERIGKINIIPRDIGKVLLNLFNNAFYTVAERKKQQGEVYEPTVSLTTKKTDGEVEIHVRDNGLGIPQKVIDKIFQPFFTTKPTGQGTGLGLSLSYDIVKAHGGQISVESKEEEGTMFRIELPV